MGRPRKYPQPLAELAVELSADAVPGLPEAPIGWQRGALLNVRNYGAEYIITLWPEEFIEERPERAVRITNPGICQDFVSKWYARESHDPRAR